MFKHVIKVYSHRISTNIKSTYINGFFFFLALSHFIYCDSFDSINIINIMNSIIVGGFKYNTSLTTRGIFIFLDRLMRDREK